MTPRRIAGSVFLSSAVWLAAAINGQSVPSAQNASEPNPTFNAPASTLPSKRGASVKTAPSMKVQESPQSQIAHAEDSSPITVPDVRKPFVKVLYDWGPWVFNLCLVIVGAFQVWLLKVTWKAIGLQAAFQEFGVRPWVEITDWKINFEPAKDDTEVPGKLPYLQYTFKMFNRTQLPVSIRRVLIRVTSNLRHYDVFEMTEEFFVPPNSNRDAFIGIMNIELDDQQVKLFEQSEFFLDLSGEVFLLDGKGALIAQPFRRRVICGPDKEEEYKYVGRNLRKVSSGVGMTEGGDLSKKTSMNEAKSRKTPFEVKGTEKSRSRSNRSRRPM